jgi:hypothetical protein
LDLIEKNPEFSPFVENINGVLRINKTKKDLAGRTYQQVLDEKNRGVASAQFVNF